MSSKTQITRRSKNGNKPPFKLEAPVTEELRNEVDAVAMEEGLSRADIIRIAIRDFLKRRAFAQMEKIGA